MILDVVDPEKTPHLSMKDRLILALFDLGICTKPQLKTISGWTDNQIHGAIQRVRLAAGKKKAEEWIRSWQPKRNKPYVFALGPAGHAYARELRGEYNGNGHPPAGQVWHFVGLAEVLCRLMRSELEVLSWLSGRESASWLWHSLKQKGDSNPSTPLRPDAMVQVRLRGKTPQWWMIEYDLSTEPPVRLIGKFMKYLSLSQILDLQKIPLLFVTVNERRKQIAMQAFEQAIRSHEATWDQIHFTVEGEEPDYLIDWLNGLSIG